MQEYTIYPLAVGINETDQGIMTYQRGYGKRIYLPIYSFLLLGGEKNILIDTGLEEFMVPEGAEESLGFKIEEIEEALSKFQLQPSDIDVIIQTHLHNDHCENTYKFPQAEIFVQDKEYQFFLNPHPIDHRYYSDLLEENNVILLNGDSEIASGIRVVLTPGHTAGGQSVIINTKDGEILITGFCCNQENFPSYGPAIPPGVHLDAIEAYDNAQKVKELASRVIPLHDISLGKLSQIP